MDRECLREAFGAYVAAYDADDPKIRLKIDHSYRVADLAERIAKRLAGAEHEATAGMDHAEADAQKLAGADHAGADAQKLAGAEHEAMVGMDHARADAQKLVGADVQKLAGAEHAAPAAAAAEKLAGADPDFAWTIGLLHDIGRFEQVRRYGTFVDADSVDHAELGADLLFHEGVLEQLGGGFLTAEQRRVMEAAVRYHGLYRVPEGLSKQEKLYCDLLRDADKIDIFRVLCDTPMEEIYDVSTQELKTAAVSDEVKACFLAHTAVLRSKRRTPIDKTVGHICLAFELVYPISREIAKEQGYVDRLLAFQSENEDTARWFAYMREHIWE